MKRLIVILLSLIIVAPLSAALPEIQERLTDDSFIGGNAHYTLSGCSILSSDEGKDAFMGNPAALGTDRYFLDLSLSAGLYNARRIMASPFITGFNTLMQQSTEVIIDSALDLLSTFSGRSPFILLDESLSFGIGGFAGGVFLRERLLTTGESAGTNAILAIDWKASLGYGHRFSINDSYAISAGTLVSYKGKFYTEDIGAELVADILLENSLINEYALFTGTSIAFDIGLRAELPGFFSIDTVARDIGSGYLMKTLNDSQGRFKENFEIATPWSLDAAIAWSPDASWIRARFELGLDGINKLAVNPSKENLLLSLHAGADVTLWNFITFTAGLYEGYPAFGMSLKLLIFNLTAGYAAEDRGTSFGLRQGEQVLLNISLTL